MLSAGRAEYAVGNEADRVALAKQVQAEGRLLRVVRACDRVWAGHEVAEWADCTDPVRQLLVQRREVPTERAAELGQVRAEQVAGVAWRNPRVGREAHQGIGAVR